MHRLLHLEVQMQGTRGWETPARRRYAMPLNDVF
jgi:hypothetical protein